MKRLLYFGVLALLACESEQEIKALQWEEIAVINGDFDHMGASLVRMGIDFTDYEGFISQAAYNPEINPDSFALSVEYLFQGELESGDAVINEYDVMFINSGTRGFGDLVYNGLDDDSTFVADEMVIENLYDYTSKANSLVVSDWAGDIIEAAWPDAITFAREDSCDESPCWDLGQAGTSTQVIARVTDETLQQELGTDSIALNFDFTYWTVMQEVAEDVNVYLRGDVEYRISDAEGTGVLEDVPLLVSFKVGGGTVIYSSFHWHSQNPDVADTILLHVAEGLTPSL